jgi:ionotropic glutamate receptor
MTAEREEFVDFTIPYYDFAGLQILMKKPPTLTFLFKFMTVFYYDVWLCIGGVLTVMCILVYLFDKFSPYSFQNRKPDAPEVMGRIFTIKESMWFAVGSYTLAGEEC